jgi:hypothetical protein
MLTQTCYRTLGERDGPSHSVFHGTDHITKSTRIGCSPNQQSKQQPPMLSCSPYSHKFYDNKIQMRRQYSRQTLPP